MRKPLVFPVLGILALGALQIKADIIDPQGVLDEFVEGIPIQDVDAFDFFANQNGGGVFNFRNVSGENWIALDFQVTLPVGSQVFCGPAPFFLVCDPIAGTPSNGTVRFDIVFESPTTPGGIKNGTIFAFNLNDPIPGDGQNFDPNGTGGWGAENGFHTVATADSPEPASYTLFVSGIALIGVSCWRRRRVTINA